MRDGVYDTPNRTLCSGIIKMIGGEKRLARGYWGDIVCSPFLSHGIYSPLKEMYEVSVQSQHEKLKFVEYKANSAFLESIELNIV